MNRDDCEFGRSCIAVVCPMYTNWKEFKLVTWQPLDDICSKPIFKNLVAIKNQRTIKEKVVDLFTGYNITMLDYHWKITKNTKGVMRYSPTLGDDIKQWLSEHPVEDLKTPLEVQDEFDLPLLRIIAGGKRNE